MATQVPIGRVADRTRSPRRLPFWLPVTPASWSAPSFSSTAARRKSEVSRRSASAHGARGSAPQFSEQEHDHVGHHRTLLLRNLQEVFGEGDPTRRRPAIEKPYTEDGTVLLLIGRYVGHAALDQVAVAPVIRASSTRHIARHRPFKTAGASHGVPGRPASRPATQGSMSSSSEMGRSPPYMFA